VFYPEKLPKMKKLLFTLTLLLPLGLWGQAQLLTDMNPGNTNTQVSETYFVNGHYLLLASNGLWVSDGTTAGTQQLSPSMIFGRVEGNFLYFTGGNGFWRTDGTSGGTEQLMYFTEASGQYHLWKTDPAGDVLLKAIPYETCSETYFDSLIYHNMDQDLRFEANYWQGHWWFQIKHEDGGYDCDDYDITYRDVWITDGTAAGTNIVYDLYPRDFMNMEFQTADANMVVYTTYSGGDCDYRFDVNVYDGTQVVSVDGYTADCGYGFPTISDFQILKGKTVYQNRNCDVSFMAIDGQTSSALLTTGYLFNIGAFRNKIMLESYRIEPGGDCEYGYAGIADVTITDGTTVGTESLGDYFMVASNTDPLLLKRVADPDEVPFPTEGNEVWISNGTAAGTVLLKDIWPGGGSSVDWRSQFIQWNDKVFFPANNGSSGMELWITDLTPTGTQLVKDINPTGTDGSLDYKPFLGATTQGVFFKADNGTAGEELWLTDGTAAGTVMLADLNSNGSSHILGGFTLGGKLIFEVQTGDATRELWVSDGTAAGTVLLMQFNTYTNNYNPTRVYEFADMGSELVLRLKDGTDSREESLWATNGTPSGTRLLASDDEWNATNDPIAEINGKILFYGKDNVNGVEPWIYEAPLTPTGDFTLIDAQADSLIGPIESGDVLDLTLLPTDRLNIMLNHVPPEVDKVWFDIDRGFSGQHDNNPPFCMARDDQAGNYFYYTFTPGPYNLTAELKDGNTIVETRTLSFTVIESPHAITGFSLVDARDNVIVGPLTNGDVIDLAAIGTHKLNIIAHTSPKTVGSVDFDLRGEATFDQYDNQPPYCLARDNQNGGYYQYLFSPGSYTLTATPYSEYMAGGTSGTPMTIGFSVVNSGARMAVPTESFLVYPNPTTGKLNLQFINVNGGKASLQVHDMQGRLLQFQTLEVQPGTSEVGVRVYDLAPGMYTMTCRFGRERYTTQFIKQ
jgi:ELWxxDGT repeat protein